MPRNSQQSSIGRVKMIILDLLKRALKIGAQPLTQVASAYSPILGMLVNTVFTAVLNAETTGKKGDEKREIAALSVQVAGPLIAEAFARSGKGIKNTELFSEGALQIQEGIVKILNSTGENTK